MKLFPKSDCHSNKKSKEKVSKGEEKKTIMMHLSLIKAARHQCGVS